jgi:inhibitor of KinA sporulation pathway (predicted exonuclease)
MDANYIVFDLEATCWKDDEKKESEIIEIGAVRMNENLDVLDSFQFFVKPTINPILSNFCLNLTTISQNEVNLAEPFNTIINKFEQWIEFPQHRINMVSYGFYDKNQLIRESVIKLYNGSILKMLQRHINIKELYSKTMHTRPCGMAEALQRLHIPFDGRHHRALDDARNIAKIFKIVYGHMLNK